MEFQLDFLNSVFVQLFPSIVKVNSTYILSNPASIQSQGDKSKPSKQDLAHWEINSSYETKFRTI